MKTPSPPCLASALHAALAGLFLITNARADDDPGKRPTATHDVVERITVTASKQPRAVSEVASNVDVLSSEELDAQLVNGLDDLLRYLPGVSMTRDAGRFGVSDLAIRGLSGNRVLIEVDGVRVGDQFTFGSFANAGRDLVDLDNIKTVELIRGSASSLYGSSAIAGVLSFISKDPRDYVNDSGDVFNRVKTHYNSANDSSGLSVTGAMQQGPIGALAIVHAAQGHEVQNGGQNTSESSARTAANPQEHDSQSALIKFTWQLNDDYLMRLTIDQREQNALTESYWSRVLSPLTNAAVDDLDGDDTQRRTRVQTDIEFNNLTSFIDAGLLQIYRQKNQTRQETVELRHSLSSNTAFRREREFYFNQDNDGVELTLSSTVGQRVRHTLTYGVDWSRTHTDEKRDGRQTNLSTNSTSNVILPDVFPVRDFPLSTTTESAIYLQDEIVLGEAGLRVIPALRYDRYQLDARSDAIFVGDNSNADAIVDLKADHTSPKLGLVLPLQNGHSVYAQYAEGFRAPPVNDVNIGFENLMFGYTSIPNPDLKPETSRNRELGWRFKSASASLDVAAFDNDYADFIDSQSVVCAPPSCSLTVFQSVNRGDVSINGYEMRATWNFGEFVDGNYWQLKSAYSHAKGRVNTSDTPLNSVAPDHWLLGVAYQTPKWNVSMINSHYAKKDRDDVALLSNNTQPFIPDAVNVLDVLGQWSFNEQLQLNVGVFNATDRDYFSWNSTQTLNATNPLLDRYRSGGRYWSMSLSVAF